MGSLDGHLVAPGSISATTTGRQSEFVPSLIRACWDGASAVEAKLLEAPELLAVGLQGGVVEGEGTPP